MSGLKRAEDIKKLLYEIVAVQSDSGTVLELEMAAKIYDLLKSDPYFKENPNQCGLFERNDVLKRPVVWGLKKGRGSRTIILMGHYDAVEIDSYGTFKPWALSPNELKQRFKDAEMTDESLLADLENDDWAFGRGMADMKAGLAINIHTLFTCDNGDVNVLFVAVPDEENMSSGALQSVYLYEELKEKFGLDYVLSLISEPQRRDVENNESIIFYAGTMGKFLPVILAKGELTHAAEIFHGLNSSFMIAEIVRNLELSTDFVSSDRGTFTQPPTVQIMKDQKTTYDVSVPEYTAACLNILFLNNKPPIVLMKMLKEVCRRSLETVFEKYNSSFDFMKEKGFIDESERVSMPNMVLSLHELRNMVKERLGDERYSEFMDGLNARIKSKIESGEETQQTASINYMKLLMNESGVHNPMVAIGVAPPYYPSTDNLSIGKDIEYCTSGISDYMNQNFGVGTKEEAYLSGMDDMSYMSCADPEGERSFLNNITMPVDVYDVPVERISALNIPSFLVGPAGRAVHQAWERVYMPDVTERIPAMFHKIIELMNKQA